jgi:hypothetical protein
MLADIGFYLILKGATSRTAADGIFAPLKRCDPRAS